MSRIILIILVALLCTTIAELQYKDINKLPKAQGCDLNDLNKQFEKLKAAITAMNWKSDSLKEYMKPISNDFKLDLEKQNDYKPTTISSDLKFFLEKLSHDLKFNNNMQRRMEQEIKNISDRLSQLESRQSLQTVSEQILKSSETLYHNITSALKHALAGERKVLSNKFEMFNDQIQSKINDLHSKPIKFADTPLWDEHFNCLQNCTPTEKLPRSCAEINDTNWGIHLIHIPNSGLQPFYVFCQGLETLIQRREVGSVNFNRNWQDYKNGFGDLNGEYWLGLERIHALTKDGKNLKIRMLDFEWKWLQADYSNFTIDDENNKYKIKSLGNYTGDSENGLAAHLGHRFYTFDDDTEIRCAGFFQSGWWFTDCYDSNLNGRYHSYADRHAPGGIQWTEDYNSLYYVVMLLTEGDEDS